LAKAAASLLAAVAKTIRRFESFPSPPTFCSQNERGSTRHSFGNAFRVLVLKTEFPSAVYRWLAKEVKMNGSDTKLPTRSMSMTTAQLLRRIRGKMRTPAPLYRMLHRHEAWFECPICGYNGPFATASAFAGSRKYAICPQCDGLERHRLQYLVMAKTLSGLDNHVKFLHFAPEKFFRQMFSERFAQYETADLFMDGVDHKVDIRALPFEDATYDVVFASHVLEHIDEDRTALREIRRVLRPNGLAVLPVPIVSDKTIEYPGANPYEAGHVRAPGVDYFDRYKEFFGKVEVWSSNSVPEKHQPFVYEDRACWPTPECPLRPPMQGQRHLDFVPVCYV
jgi:SAM-dependent methyltransferase